MREAPTRAPWLLVPALVTVLAVPACTGKVEAERLQAEKQALASQVQTLSAEKEKLALDLRSTQSGNEEMTAALEAVQTGLEEIRSKELKVLKRTIEVSKEGAPAASVRDRLSAELASIRTAIRSNLARLARLEKERKAAGVRMASLEKLSDELKRSLEEKASTIGALESRVAELTQKVETQATTLAEKDGQLTEKQGVIDEQTKALHTAYVAVAGKKDLRSRGVVDRKGAILGLGGAWERTGKYDPELFKAIDVTTEAEVTIPASAEKVRVLPGHPAESYEIVAAGPDVSTLKVTDRDAFWRDSRYLVVMIPD